MVNKYRGRPVGVSDTRQRLLDAARELFLRDGFHYTTLRGIAKRAGTDHALVNYYFGSKEGIFIAVMDLVAGPGMVVGRAADRGPERLAPQLLDAIIRAWDMPAVQDHAVRLLADIAINPTTQETFRGYIETHVVGRIAETLGGRGATSRASAGATIITGLFVTRYVARIEPIASMPRTEVVRSLAPALAAALSPRR